MSVSGPSNTVSFTVNQSGQACTFTLAPTSASHGGNMDTGAVSVTTLTGCAWTVLNTNAWIDITSPANSSGSGAVTYTVAGNPLMTARTGIVVIAGQNFPVVQAVVLLSGVLVLASYILRDIAYAWVDPRITAR